MNLTKTPKTEIVKGIAAFIAQGGIVIAKKNKNLFNGGQHTVSVGPHRTALVTDYRYAVISTGKRPAAQWEYKYKNATGAARYFVDFCGKDIAERALQDAKRDR